MRGNSFIDSPHRVAIDFFEIQKGFNGLHLNRVKNQLKRLIQKDPDYYDPYLLLYDILIEEEYEEEAEEILDIAYEKILDKITNGDGRWPERLEWGWDENRHIIRTLYNRALSFFRDDHMKEAEELFNHLFRANPNDNLGVRYYLLAIKEKLSYPEFAAAFMEDGSYSNRIDKWFLKRAGNYPKIFDWWLNFFKE